MIFLRNKRLDRRTVLRGAGTLAIALPWLEIMGRANVASAQAAQPAKRFLSVYTPGGTVAENFWPTGPADAPVLGTILAPLQPHLQKLLVLQGLDMKCAVGFQHQCGIVGWLTGSKQENAPNNYSFYPSIDQVIASKISKGVKAKPSVQMAVRWATGESFGKQTPRSVANFEDAELPSPIPPQLDPVEIFAGLFGSVMPEPSMPAASGPNRALLRQKSILDHVKPRYASLAAQLGASDQAKLEQHLNKIREIELGLDKGIPGGAGCRPPALIDTSGYNPTNGQAGEGCTKATEECAVAKSTDAMIPAVGKLMMDMMVMALGCDITAVGSFQWTDTEAKHTFPWLQLSEHHHHYQHDGGFQPEQCTRIGTWYSEMHAYLLSAMDAVDMGGHTLLDESVIFFGSELSEPPTHLSLNMPFFLAGKGGGLLGGRHLQFDSRPHNDLLVAILNLFGDQRATYGDPECCTGPLPGLTA